MLKSTSVWADCTGVSEPQSTVLSIAPIDRRDEIRVEDTPGQEAAVRAVAVIALVATGAYLIWRTTATIGDLWVGIPLLVLEYHMASGLALFTFSLWDISTPPRSASQGAAAPTTGPRTDRDHASTGPDQSAASDQSTKPDKSTAPDHLRVAVLIPTYDEPEEVLIPTIAAAVTLREASAVYVLDDGNREWVRELAESLGAHHMTRQDHSHAKAGNVNAAIKALDGRYDLLAMLDADHVPTANFLANTIEYFRDPSIALVQTPQDFYNSGSFEHAPNRSLLWRRRRGVRYSEQGLFYRVIQPGKNRWNAAFWCGTNAVLRVAALDDVGGVATESITEDIHTTLRMHRRGWRTIYHNEVLAFGLAARNVDEYQVQRLRWGTGAMQLLRIEHPLTAPGLTIPQRLAYATTLLGWFDAWRTLGFLLLPIAVLLTGAMPIRADIVVFATAFIAVTLLQRVAMAALSRGFAPQGMATVFELIRLPANLAVSLTLLRSRSQRFVVTPKGTDNQVSQRVPLLLSIVAISHVIALVVFGLTVAGATPWTYEVPGVAIGTAIFAVGNLVLLLIAVVRIRAIRFGGERRRGERFRVKMFSRLGADVVEVLDVSLSGALLVTRSRRPVAGSELRLAHDRGDEVLLRVTERSRSTVSRPLEPYPSEHEFSGTQNDPVENYLVAVEFDNGQEMALAELSRILFAARSDVRERTAVDRATDEPAATVDRTADEPAPGGSTTRPIDTAKRPRSVGRVG